MADESWLEPKSSEELSEILAQLRPKLEEIYGDRLVGLYLCGSYARGDARPGSDLDVLLVLNHVDFFTGGRLAGTYSVHGFSTGTPRSAQSPSFRVTNVRSWTDGAGGR